MQEEWKPLIYHGEDFGDVYEISNTGKLRNCITGKERKLNIHHWTVSAMLNGESYKYADEPWFACAQ